IPFDETYILYNPHDILSLVCVFFSLLPILLLVFYFSWFVTTRELESCIMAAGHVVNNIINHVIKNILKHQRPTYLDNLQEKLPLLRNQYGMPSAHSQFMGFFSMFFSLRFLLQFKNLTLFEKFIIIVVLNSMSIMTAFSRVYLYYHSADQVCVGLLLGWLLGSIFFLIVSFLRDFGIIKYLLKNFKIFKIFYLKDSFYDNYDSTLKTQYSNY
ncbi:dolichyldiphosphatase, partial [Ascoidea rubescens DSM 1968]